MKYLLIFPLLLCLLKGNAQTRELDLETIWASGVLVPEMYDGVIHMDDGEHYARILRDYSNPAYISEKIMLYKYGEDTPSKTLFDNKEAPEGFGSISEFTLSKSGKLILFETEFQGIYRYSYTAVYYVYNTENKKWHTVAEGNSVMYGTLSPDEQNIAYVFKNDLYIEPLFSGEGEQKSHKHRWRRGCYSKW